MNQPTTSPRRLHPLIATAAATIIIASLAATAAITGVFPKASGTGGETAQTRSAQVANQPVVDTAAPAAVGGSQQQAAAQPPGAQAGEATSGYAGQRQPSQPLQSSISPSQSAAQPPAESAYAQQPQPQPQPQYAQQPYGQPQQYAQQQGNPQPSYAPQQTQQPYTPPQQRAAAPCASCGTVESISAVRHEGRGTGLGAVGGAVAGGLIGNQFGAGTGRLGMTALGAVGGGFAGNAVEKHLRSTTVYQVRVRMQNGRTRYFTYHQAPPFQQGEPVRIEHGALVAR